MCYYSKTLHASRFRAAKEGEDLVLHSDGSHTYPVGSDGKIVCMTAGTQVHIDKLELNPNFAAQAKREHYRTIKMMGQPISTVFYEGTPHGYASDRIMVDGVALHLIYLMPGTKLYTGPKRVDLVTSLGVDDPSIALDHNTDEPAPTVARTLDRIFGLCSITR